MEYVYLTIWILGAVLGLLGLRIQFLRMKKRYLTSEEEGDITAKAISILVWPIAIPLICMFLLVWKGSVFFDKKVLSWAAELPEKIAEERERRKQNKLKKENDLKIKEAETRLYR